MALSVVAAIIAAVLAAVLWLTSPRYSRNEPKPVPHWIPIIGHALSVSGASRNPFLKRISKERKGEPFTVFVAGRKHYVFHKAGEYGAIFRHGKSLDNGIFIRLILTNWFSESPHAAHTLTNEYKLRVHHLHTDTLLRAENNQPTAMKYYEELERAMQELDAELMRSEEKQLIKEALQIVITQQGHPSTDAYFGRELREGYPNVMDDLCVFNREGFWPLLFGAPRWMFPRPHAARDRLLASCIKLANRVRERGGGVAAPVIEGRIYIGDDISDDTGAKEAFSILFGLNSNSIPNAYCALLHILQEPAVVETLRQELISVGYPKMKPAEYSTIFPDSTPRLRSFLQESLRYHIAASTIREVMQDTIVTIDDKQWELKKGGIVNLSSQLLGMDEATHPNPSKFDPERFLEKSLGGKGENFSKTVKPFGGGSGYCPGRIFAEKQIMAFLAAMIMRYEMEIVTQEYELPSTSELERVLCEPKIEMKIKMRA